MITFLFHHHKFWAIKKTSKYNFYFYFLLKNYNLINIIIYFNYYILYSSNV